ncbi:MAG TPA: arginine--tRNA ligase [Acidobacteriota bacterium]|nr:arginine--tRNA ligase [Acidobacteriota bacterium]
MTSALQQDQIVATIRRALQELSIEAPRDIPLNKIPFSGMWGFAMPCFPLAVAEKKAGKDVQVGPRAQEISEVLAERLEGGGEFAKVEALKGYVNLFFELGEVADDLISSVLELQEAFGRGHDKGERVMIEYSQPNTHKAFHVGHLRNVCLGDSLANILAFAGFDTIKANYPGDIGMHVIKCLWCYLRFHKGGEPEEHKGRWLGQIYAEADGLLSQANVYRDRVLAFLGRLVMEEPAGPQVRQELARRFFDRVEAALAEAQEEHRRDILSVVRHFFLRQKMEFNEIAHRPLADWVWLLWTDCASWLKQLVQEHPRQEHPERHDALKALLEEWREIGLDEEAWRYARDLRDLFHRWERRDEDLVELWRKTRQWSLDDFHRIYDELGVHFDEWFYESDVEDTGKEIVDEIIAKGFATDLRPNGPVLVEIDKQLGLDKPTYRTLVILRSDNTSLYSTKDLALAKLKFEKHKVDRSIYVVDVGQALYFQQIFKVLELWGFEQAEKCFHLAYEIVRLPSGKMSSRAGEVVFYDDFFQEAYQRARSNVDQKRSEEQYADLPDLDRRQREEVALAVALGAMKYGMLSVDNNKQINFDFESALSFEGQTAPYIQYAHARCCRILEKAGVEEAPPPRYQEAAVEESETNLLEAISSLGAEVQRASREYKPLYIATYLYKLAKSFNDFYRDCPVLKAEGALRDSRLALVAATRQTLSNGLALLGIPAPEYM